jgi:hypothetical protein
MQSTWGSKIVIGALVGGVCLVNCGVSQDYARARKWYLLVARLDVIWRRLGDYPLCKADWLVFVV